MKINLMPLLVEDFLGEKFPNLYEYNVKDIREVEKERSKTEGKRLQGSFGLKYISRVLGTDFSDFDRFVAFAKTYGVLPLIEMVGDEGVKNNLYYTLPVSDKSVVSENISYYKELISKQKNAFPGYERVVSDLERKGLRKKDLEFLNLVLLQVLHKSISKDLVEFQASLTSLKEDPIFKDLDTLGQVDWLFQMSSYYGIKLFVAYGETPFFGLTGMDFRAGVLLLLAQEINAGREFPEPTDVLCKICDNPIIPWVYDGVHYCSPKCAARASNKSELKPLKDRVRKKAERKFKSNPDKLKAFRQDLKVAIAKGEGEKGIKKVCKDYGIDPKPGKPGRPRKKS